MQSMVRLPCSSADLPHFKIGFSSALGKEVAPFGIRVVTVHPSITKSSFGENVKPGGREFPTEIYDKISAEHAKNLAGGIAGAQEPDTVAKACLEAALDQDKERVHYFCDAVTEERAAGILKEPRKDRPTFY